MKSGPQISPMVAGVAVVVVVVIAGYLLWGMTGKKTATVKDPNQFKDAYQKAQGFRPGSAGGGANPNMEDAMKRMRSGQGSAPAGNSGSGQ